MTQGICIRNGRVVDPGDNVDAIGDLVIRNGKIVSHSAADALPGDEAVDASGCIVTPGLIDFHSHLAKWNTDMGVHPDLMCLPNGITAAVDAGSVGSAGAEGFIRYTMAGAETTLRLFVNVSAIGVATEKYNENPNPELFDADALLRVCEQYPDEILGLKIRLGAKFSPGLGTRSLEAAKKIAGEAGKPLCVHCTGGEFPLSEILDRLDAGDIFCHCFQSMGATILDGGGRLHSAVVAARARGVVFDAAVGRINHDFEIIRAALAQGFPPDIISTDTVAGSVYGHKLFHLVRTLSLFLNIGMPLAEVLRAATATPARHMNMAGRIGTLRPGAQADVAIFAIREKEMVFSDQYGHSFKGDTLLLPRATVKRGRFVFKQIDFEY